ncbi:hypothetical protein TNCV_1543561 [Trichonephila clavipes]|nr:hypothetical protein TNCV_1543561 [Trichonephila clavipes]
MSYHSVFQGDQIARVRLAGASGTETSLLLDISKGTVHNVMTEYTQCGKTSSAKQNSRRKQKISERGQWILKWIALSKKRTTEAKVTAELNQYLKYPGSMITIRRFLHKQSIYKRTSILPNPLSQMLMPNVVYSSVTLAKPGRLISREINMV